MKITYELEHSDFLTNQLYLASKSSRIKKKRIKNKLIPALIYVVLGIMCYIKTNNILILSGFMSLGILWLLFFPIWERKHYMQHYQSFIHENYQARFNQIVSLEFGQDYLFFQDDFTEGKIANHSILSIIELKELILLHIGVGQNILLPKAQIADVDQLIMYLKEWAKNLNIEYKNQQSWQFK